MLGPFLVLALTLTLVDSVRALAYPPVLVPDEGAYLGSIVGERPGETGQDPIRRVERSIDRRFAIDHRFYRWDQALPTDYERETYRAGRLPFVNWKAMRLDGGIVPWREIAAGTHDPWIVRQARRIRRFGAPMYLTFHHEPENDPAFGTPEEFASAFRHVVKVFREQRARNVAFAWTMMGWTFNDRSGRDPMDWYPGDGFVDIIGVDGYNWFPLRPGARWSTLRETIRPAMPFARAHEKPVFVVEFGVMEDPDGPDRKADWFREVAELAHDWPNLKALIYFDKIKDGWPWNSDSSTESLAGYRDMAASRSVRAMPQPR